MTGAAIGVPDQLGLCRFQLISSYVDRTFPSIPSSSALSNVSLTCWSVGLGGYDSHERTSRSEILLHSYFGTDHRRVNRGRGKSLEGRSDRGREAGPPSLLDNLAQNLKRVPEQALARVAEHCG